MMVATKIGKGIYCYKGVRVEFDDERPNLGWYIIWGDQVERFAQRTEAQRQIDRLLCLDAGAMAQAPSAAEVGALDLSLYVDDELLATMQRRLGDQGRPYSRRQLEQLAQAGAGPGKRQMLAVVIGRLLGL